MNIVNRLFIFSGPLLCATLATAQTRINPSQIKPSPTNGQVLTTVNGVTQWSPSGIPSEIIVGQGLNTTIQAAVNAAGTSGSVVVPASIPAGEMAFPATEISATAQSTSHYSNFGTVNVRDLRPLNDDVSLSEILALPQIDGTGGNTSSFARCMQSGACKILYLGDSIGEGISGVAPDDNVATHVFDEFKRRFPLVSFTFQNLSIGGTGIEQFNDGSYICNNPPGSNQFFRPLPSNWYIQSNPGGNFISGPMYYQWPFQCTVGASWKAHAASFNPDLVIIAFGANEYGYGSNAFAADLQTAISFFSGLPGNPTIVLQTTEPPNPSWTSLLPYDQPTFEGINEAIRGVAAANGFLLADPDRYYSVITYGIDPANKHYNVEHAWGTMSGVNFPAGWDIPSGYSGTFPVLTSSGQLDAQLAWTSDSAAIVERQRSAMDITWHFELSGASSTAEPVIFFRMRPGLEPGYKLLISQSSAGGNTTYTASVSYVGTYTDPGIGLTSGTCTYTTGTQVGFTLVLKGTKLDFWCNQVGNQGWIDAINTRVYVSQSEGTVAIGMFDSGGGTGTGNLSNEYIYFGNPAQYFTPKVSIMSQLGLQSPPGFGGSYQGDGDFDTNYKSFGGDGVHHPSPIGFDAFLAAYRPVFDVLSQVYPKAHYPVTNGTASGPYGGLQDSGDGHVDLVAGPNGGRFVNNANNTIIEQWGPTSHQFNEQIQSNVAQGTPPFIVSSTTPVANLSASPIVYDANGNQLANVHAVIGSATLSGGTYTLTLSGAAAFSTSINCVASDVSSTATPINFQAISASSGKFIGTAGDSFFYQCWGY